MKRASVWALTALASATITLTVVVMSAKHDERFGPRRYLAPEVERAARERMEIDRLYGPEPSEAKRRYSEFIAGHEESPLVEVRDQVGAARLRLGYLAAKEGDFQAARSTFLQASQSHADSEAISVEFGGLSDQAAYQAAVCLVAEGRASEAKLEFLAFLKERPQSPLVHAAYRRIERLDDADALREAEGLLQSAVTKQEERLRFESSVCGPKVIAYLFDKGILAAQGTKPGYREIAKLCGTSEDGTTLEGMRSGLRALGVASYGVQLNRKDLLALKAPAILLDGEHYVALLDATPNYLDLFDPLVRSQRRVELGSDDPSRLWTLLTFSPPVLNRN